MCRYIKVGKGSKLCYPIVLLQVTLGSFSIVFCVGWSGVYGLPHYTISRAWNLLICIVSCLGLGNWRPRYVGWRGCAQRYILA